MGTAKDVMAESSGADEEEADEVLSEKGVVTHRNPARGSANSRARHEGAKTAREAVRGSSTHHVLQAAREPRCEVQRLLQCNATMQSS